jgi:hypothetical protein
MQLTRTLAIKLATLFTIFNAHAVVLKGPGALRQQAIIQAFAREQQERLARSIMSCDVEALQQEVQRCTVHMLFSLHVADAARTALGLSSEEANKSKRAREEYSPYFMIGKGLSELDQEKYLQIVEVLLKAGASVDRGASHGTTFRKKIYRKRGIDGISSSTVEKIRALVNKYQPKPK